MTASLSVALWAFGLSKIQNMFTRNKPQIRAAQPQDLPIIVRLIEELAEFEQLTHLLEVTPRNSDPTSLVPGPWPSAWSARSTARRWPCHLLHKLLDLPGQARHVPGRPVRAPGAPPQRPGQGAAGAHGRAGPRRAAMGASSGRCWLERGRRPLLPKSSVPRCCPTGNSAA